MNKREKSAQIVSIDDDPDILRLIHRILTARGYGVATAGNGAKGVELVQRIRPNLILLDIVMAGMDGYEVCSQLKKNKETALVPVIFLTSLDAAQDKARAFSAGAVDYLIKPIQKEQLVEKVRIHLETEKKWQQLKAPGPENLKPVSAEFFQFKEFLSGQLDLKPEDKKRFEKISAVNVYDLCVDFEIRPERLARYMATFSKVPYVSFVSPDDILLGVLPERFCQFNKVVVVREPEDGQAFVLSNPFNTELLGLLKHHSGMASHADMKITEPANIESLWHYSAMEPAKEILSPGPLPVIEQRELAKKPLVPMAQTMLLKAITEKASDIHMESKENGSVVRFRVDGILREAFVLKPEPAAMIISSLKAHADMDIAEKRRPQDGGFKAVFHNKKFNFRLATASTPNGESLTIRLLETHSVPKRLKSLGMTGEQESRVIALGNRNQGLICMVGPTGSGKTTSIYHLLHQIDCTSRSLLTVENPVEYDIPFANQEQVNEKAGITFESILRSSVRQDPDILYVGEIRDQYSAKICMDFASTGHLVITTLHAANATAAIFRFERLGIDRQIISESVIAIVAQRLLRKLCPYCKKVLPVSDEEAGQLSPFTQQIPHGLAHPVGCLKCKNSGYLGREGLYEVLDFDSHISEMVRTKVPIPVIRNFVREQTQTLLGNHAVEKVKDLVFAPEDVYREILVEEATSALPKPFEQAVSEKTQVPDTARILVADDDEDVRKWLDRIFQNQGYEVVSVANGMDAMLALDRRAFDLILSDVNMPHLDGFTLLEIMNQKDIQTPVIFLTGRTDAKDEKRGLELGAIDYIRKPIQKDLLLLRVKNILQKQSR